MQICDAFIISHYIFVNLQYDDFTNHVIPTWHIFTEYNTNAQTWSHSTHSHQATLLLPFKTRPDCATTLCVSNTRSFQRQLHGSLETLQNTHQLFTMNCKGMFSEVVDSTSGSILLQSTYFTKYNGCWLDLKHIPVSKRILDPHNLKYSVTAWKKSCCFTQVGANVSSVH